MPAAPLRVQGQASIDRLGGMWGRGGYSGAKHVRMRVCVCGPAPVWSPPLTGLVPSPAASTEEVPTTAPALMHPQQAIADGEYPPTPSSFILRSPARDGPSIAVRTRHFTLGVPPPDVMGPDQFWLEPLTVFPSAGAYIQDAWTQVHIGLRLTGGVPVPRPEGRDPLPTYGPSTPERPRPPTATPSIVVFDDAPDSRVTAAFGIIRDPCFIPAGSLDWLQRALDRVGGALPMARNQYVRGRVAILRVTLFEAGLSFLRQARCGYGDRRSLRLTFTRHNAVYAFLRAFPPGAWVDLTLEEAEGLDAVVQGWYMQALMYLAGRPWPPGW